MKASPRTVRKEPQEGRPGEEVRQAAGCALPAAAEVLASRSVRGPPVPARATAPRRGFFSRSRTNRAEPRFPARAPLSCSTLPLRSATACTCNSIPATDLDAAPGVFGCGSVNERINTCSLRGRLRRVKRENSWGRNEPSATVRSSRAIPR